MKLLVRRDALTEYRIAAIPEQALASGEVELRVDRFAFTANNVTYGVIGEAFGYWRFFPTPEQGFGLLPVWGFGTVLRSEHAGVQVGERFYGYFPLASRVVVQPGTVNRAGFEDGAPHRAGLGSIYNRYLRTTADAAYRPEHERIIPLFRPLFGTAFFIDDYLAESAFMGGELVVFASASSKTAYSTAFLLKERRARGASVRTLGLTSARNRAFVESLGLYDEVVTYDAIDTVAPRPAVYFDMAGSGTVTAAVHRRFGDALKHSAIVGSTHWAEGRDPTAALPGPAPELFFVPPIMEKRAAELGPQVLQARLGAAWQGFTARLLDPSTGWLRVVEGSGPAAIEQVYTAALRGELDPRDGHILSFGE